MKENVVEKGHEGKLVKVVFRDGNNVRSIRGELKQSEGDFLSIRTLKQNFLINKADVIKIQIPNAGGGSDERE